MDEHEIITLFQAGDLKADRILFDEFYQRLSYFTGRLADDSSEGQQIVIDVFERLFQKRRDFDSLVNIKAFLYISCRNRCLNYLRNRERNRKKEEAFISQQDDRFVEREFIEANFIERIHQAVKSLPDQCRSVIQMIYFEDRKYDEIALALGIAESTVRNQKRRGIQLLREKLGPTQFLLLALMAYGDLLQYVPFHPSTGNYF